MAPLIELEEVLVTVPVPQLLLTSVTVDEVEENDAAVTEQSAIMKKKKNNICMYFEVSQFKHNHVYSLTCFMLL